MIHDFYIMDVIDRPKKRFFVLVTRRVTGPDMKTIESVRVQGTKSWAKMMSLVRVEMSSRMEVYMEVLES